MWTFTIFSRLRKILRKKGMGKRWDGIFPEWKVEKKKDDEVNVDKFCDGSSPCAHQRHKPCSGEKQKQ
jgi:hypothetical protein